MNRTLTSSELVYMTTTADNDVRLAEYTRWMRAAGKLHSTIELRQYQITRLAHDISRPMAASTNDLVAWLGEQPWSASTRRSYRTALRSYYAWAHHAGHLDEDPSRLLPTIRVHPGVPRPADDSTVVRATASADDRVRMMLALAGQAGLRRGEVARVHTRDVVQDLGGWSLRVRGKGERERVVPLTATLADLLRAAPAGWVFPSPGGGHLTPAHVGKLMSRALGPGVTAHQLRHRFATRAYGVNRDLLSVQQLLGHAKPETTMVYTQIPAGAKRMIVDAAA